MGMAFLPVGREVIQGFVMVVMRKELGVRSVR